MKSGGCKLGRIQNNRVKALAVFGVLAQHGVDVGVQHGGAGCVETVERHVLFGPLDCRGGRVNRRDMRRATTESGHRKATGVTVAIKHILKLQPARVSCKPGPAVALVEVEPGFMTLSDVQLKLPSVLADGDSGIAATSQPASGLGQAF